MKKIVLDQYYCFERHVGYIPSRYIKVEDEIRDICDKNKILVQEIIRYDGYKVVGKKIRNRKTYEKAKVALIK